jgi:antitoxin (DNA-binding transcriptional repressor) of toxin-antitoxin stability system
MPTIRLNIDEVHESLRDLVTKVLSGSEIEIAEKGQLVAKLIPYEEAARRRGFGMFKGKIWIADDFDAPMSDEELKEWGML